MIRILDSWTAIKRYTRPLRCSVVTAACCVAGAADIQLRHQGDAALQPPIFRQRDGHPGGVPSGCLVHRQPHIRCPFLRQPAACQPGGSLTVMRDDSLPREPAVCVIVARLIQSSVARGLDARSVFRRPRAQHLHGGSIWSEMGFAEAQVMQALMLLRISAVQQPCISVFFQMIRSIATAGCWVRCTTYCSICDLPHNSISECMMNRI